MESSGQSIDTASPDHIIAYVDYLSKTYKYSTMWTRVSAVKNLLLARNGISIPDDLVNKYLKMGSKIEKPKQSAVFSRDDVIRVHVNEILSREILGSIFSSRSR